MSSLQGVSYLACYTDIAGAGRLSWHPRFASTVVEALLFLIPLARGNALPSRSEALDRKDGAVMGPTLVSE